MLIVGDEAGVVDVSLRAGQLACPHCKAELRPWGHARARTARLADLTERHRPRRARCRTCHKTSVLLADRFFARRQDSAEVIGQALLAKAAGRPEGRGGRLGRTRETVRNWFRSFGTRAGSICGTSSPGRSPWTPASTRWWRTAQLLPTPSRPSPWRRERRASPLAPAGVVLGFSDEPGRAAFQHDLALPGAAINGEPSNCHGFPIAKGGRDKWTAPKT